MLLISEIYPSFGITASILNIYFCQQLLENLTVEVSNFVPPKALDMNQFNILLVGPVGAGKSSFVNNVTSSYRDYVTSQAGSGSAEHSLTSMVGYLVFLYIVSFV